MTTIKILVVDDNPDDRTLAKRELKREFANAEIIETSNLQEFQTLLTNKDIDLVITDYLLRWSNGLEILKMVKKLYPDCPVVMFTGTGSEEIAVEAMKEGLDDYVIKSPQHYLRLAKAVRLVYDRSQQQQAIESLESQYRRLFESVPVGLYRMRSNGEILEANLALLDILGYPDPEAIRNVNLFKKHFDPQVLKSFQEQLQQPEATQSLEIPLRRRDNRQIWVRHSVRLVGDEEQNILYYEGAIEDVTQRKQAESEITQLLEREREAREEAEAANRLKDEFLATLSHELRTPLNSISGWVQMIQRGRLSSERSKEAITIIERNVKAQTQLVEDLLDVSRIIRGKMKLVMRSVDLSQVVGSAIDTVRPTAAAKSVTVELTSVGSDVETIQGDPERLRQVVWNLLINAIKFTPTGGQVRVDLERVDSMIAIHVTDTGIGLEPDILPYVFDRFRQVDGTSRRTYGGLGLGLAIVRHLTELHGGQVAVSSEGKNKGSTFSVKFPIPSNQQLTQAKETAELTDSLPNLTHVKVLVVEDEPDALQLIAIILQESQAQVCPVSSVAEALPTLENESFDLLISDISMPEADGYDLIKRVRASQPELPAIALTAYASRQDRDRALSAGFDLHLAKPVDPDQLLDAVVKLTRESP